MVSEFLKPSNVGILGASVSEKLDRTVVITFQMKAISGGEWDGYLKKNCELISDLLGQDLLISK